MMIQAIESKGKTLITIKNIQRIDKNNVDELNAGIDRFIKENHEIFLNLNKVFFLDTEGFLLLVNLVNKSKSVNCTFKLFQISDALSELFNLMEMYDKFEWASAEQLSDPAFCDF